MACCEVIYRTFVNEAVTTVPFTGAVPTVTISYLLDGEWSVSVATVVKIVGGSVVIDHGGIATGLIKILQ